MGRVPNLRIMSLLGLADLTLPRLYGVPIASMQGRRHLVIFQQIYTYRAYICPCVCVYMGSSINDVMLFWGIFFYASFNIVGHANLNPSSPPPPSGMSLCMDNPT